MQKKKKKKKKNISKKIARELFLRHLDPHYDVVLANACLFTTPHQRHIRAERLVLSTSERNTEQFGKNRLHGFRISEEMSIANVEDDGRIRDGRRISAYTISPYMGIHLR